MLFLCFYCLSLIFTAHKNIRLLYTTADFIGCLENTYHQRDYGYTTLVAMLNDKALKTIHTKSSHENAKVSWKSATLS
jgi:hypothetical protein